MALKPSITDRTELGMTRRKRIRVLLNKGGNPEVVVDSMVWAKPRMRWVRDKDSEPFKFVDFKFIVPPDPAATFDSANVKNKRIKLKCKNINNTIPITDWIYKITVVDDEGVLHTTDEVDPPGGDKPVIRN